MQKSCIPALLQAASWQAQNDAVLPVARAVLSALPAGKKLTTTELAEAIAYDGMESLGDTAFEAVEMALPLVFKCLQRFARHDLKHCWAEGPVKRTYGREGRAKLWHAPDPSRCTVSAPELLRSFAAFAGEFAFLTGEQVLALEALAAQAKALSEAGKHSPK